MKCHQSNTAPLFSLQVLQSSDLPAGLVSVITGSQDQMTSALATHSVIKAIWYWGSAEVSVVALPNLWSLKERNSSVTYLRLSSAPGLSVPAAHLHQPHENHLPFPPKGWGWRGGRQGKGLDSSRDFGRNVEKCRAVEDRLDSYSLKVHGCRLLLRI